MTNTRRRRFKWPRLTSTAGLRGLARLFAHPYLPSARLKAVLRRGHISTRLSQRAGLTSDSSL